MSASSDGGRTFASPVRLGDHAAGTVSHWDYAAALGRDGVAWVLTEGDGALRLYRSGDFGVTWPEPARVCHDASWRAVA